MRCGFLRSCPGVWGSKGSYGLLTIRVTGRSALAAHDRADCGAGRLSFRRRGSDPARRGRTGSQRYQGSFPPRRGSGKILDATAANQYYAPPKKDQQYIFDTFGASSSRCSAVRLLQIDPTIAHTIIAAKSATTIPFSSTITRPNHRAIVFAYRGRSGGLAVPGNTPNTTRA
jgi:hypothetical protein